jgi:hypothetical protein
LQISAATILKYVVLACLGALVFALSRLLKRAVREELWPTNNFDTLRAIVQESRHFKVETSETLDTTRTDEVVEHGATADDAVSAHVRPTQWLLRWIENISSDPLRAQQDRP